MDSGIAAALVIFHDHFMRAFGEIALNLVHIIATAAVPLVNDAFAVHIDPNAVVGAGFKAIAPLVEI